MREEIFKSVTNAARGLSLRLVGKAGAKKHLSVVEQLAVGNRGQVCLVRVGGTHFVVGIGTNGVTCIAPAGSDVVERSL